MACGKYGRKKLFKIRQYTNAKIKSKNLDNLVDQTRLVMQKNLFYEYLVKHVYNLTCHEQQERAICLLGRYGFIKTLSISREKYYRRELLSLKMKKQDL